MSEMFSYRMAVNFQECQFLWKSENAIVNFHCFKFHDYNPLNGRGTALIANKLYNRIDAQALSHAGRPCSVSLSPSHFCKEIQTNNTYYYSWRCFSWTTAKIATCEQQHWKQLARLPWCFGHAPATIHANYCSLSPTHFCKEIWITWAKT